MLSSPSESSDSQSEVDRLLKASTEDNISYIQITLLHRHHLMHEGIKWWFMQDRITTMVQYLR